MADSKGPALEPVFIDHLVDELLSEVLRRGNVVGRWLPSEFGQNDFDLEKG